MKRTNLHPGPKLMAFPLINTPKWCRGLTPKELIPSGYQNLFGIIITSNLHGFLAEVNSQVNNLQVDNKV